jgi:DNA-binding transcriptional ArsR family regulator
MMRYQGVTAELDRTLVAIADPVRRRILEQLGDGEARVTEIARQFPISLNAVSKHLKLLERASLIDRRVAGRDHFIRVRPEPLQAAQAWIATQQAFWGSRLAGIDALLTAEDAAAVPRPPSGDSR